MTDYPEQLGLQRHTGAAARAAVAFLEKFDGWYYDALRALSDAVLNLAHEDAASILKDLDGHVTPPAHTLQMLEKALQFGSVDQSTFHLLLQRERAAGFLKLVDRLSRIKRAADRIIDLANELEDEENVSSAYPSADKAAP